jgi:transcriptional regulator with XRE-family HTH domain
MDRRPSTRTVKADGEIVKQLRLNKGWRPEDLARRAGCSKKTVENVERGANAYLFTLQNIAEALDVEFRALLPKVECESKEPRFVEVQIKLSIPYAEFDESEQLVTLVRSLNLLLQGKHEIGALKVQEGSTIVTLEMDAVDVGELIELLLTGKLDELQIIGINASTAWSDELDKEYADYLASDGVWIEKRPTPTLRYLRDQVEKSKRAKRKPKPHKPNE